MDAVIAICKNNIDVNKIFVNNNKSITIDGTTACGKTTISSQLGLQVIKTQRNNKIDEINSSNISFLGYIFSGIVDRSINNDWVICDRVIHNNYDWSIIWSLLTLFIEKYDNVEVDYETHSEFFEELKKICYHYVNSSTFEFCRRYGNIICLIDSNVQRVRARLNTRCEKSDVERSKLLCYVPIQNEFYKCVYHRNLCIDLNWFPDDTNLNIINMGIVEFIKYIIMNYCKIIMKQPKFNNNYKPIMTMNTLPYSFKNDARKYILDAHVYRNVKRAQWSLPDDKISVPFGLNVKNIQNRHGDFYNIMFQNELYYENRYKSILKIIEDSKEEKLRVVEEEEDDDEEDTL